MLQLLGLARGLDLINNAGMKSSSEQLGGRAVITFKTSTEVTDLIAVKLQPR